MVFFNWNPKTVVVVSSSMLPKGSWLTTTEDGFMEPKYDAFRRSQSSAENMIGSLGEVQQVIFKTTDPL